MTRCISPLHIDQEVFLVDSVNLLHRARVIHHDNMRLSWGFDVFKSLGVEEMDAVFIAKRIIDKDH